MTVTNPQVERINVNPKDLLVDLNVRLNANLNREFIASIKDLGVLQPIVAVRTASGDIRVRYGHRRTLASIEAGLKTVPVDVIGNEGTGDTANIERVIAQHAENAHRAALTSTEEVGVVEQLAAFGMSASQIQKRTHMKRSTVNQAVAVAASELAKAAAGRYEFLTLEQAATVAEFDSDAEAAKALIAAAKSGSFEHVAQRVRDERRERVARSAVESDLAELSVRVIDRPKWTDPTKRLDSLFQNGATIMREQHAGCPGNAAYIDEQWSSSDDDEASEFVAIFVCTDPVTNGHSITGGKVPHSSRQRSPEQVEAASAERREVLTNNKAWRSAEVVRREWLGEFLGRKTPPKGAVAFVAQQMLSGAYEVSKAMERGNPSALFFMHLNGSVNGGRLNRDEVAKLIGSSTDARLTVIALAVVLGALEGEMDVQTWRSPTPGARSYLRVLEGWGYQLSDIERSTLGEAEQA